jgi:hypothetical protein
MCLGVKHTFTMGENARDEAQWLPRAPPILGVTHVWELRMFKALVGKGKKYQIGPLGHDSKGIEV